MFLVTLPKIIDELAPRLRELYKRIQEQEEEIYHYPFYKLIEDLKKQDKLLFVEYEDNKLISFAIVDFLTYDKLKSLRIMYAAGIMNEKWPAYIDFFEAFGKQFNIDFLEVWGRPGWSKLLKPKGFRTKVVNYVKRLQ
jgi:hypothetical protein